MVAVDGRRRVVAAERSEGFSLDLLRDAALPQKEPNDDIEDTIDAETKNRSEMGYWSELLDAALQHATELRHVAGREPAGPARFELASWFQMRVRASGRAGLALRPQDGGTGNPAGHQELDVAQRQRVAAVTVSTAARSCRPAAASVGDRTPNAARAHRQRSARGTLGSMSIDAVVGPAGVGPQAVLAVGDLEGGSR